MNKKRSGFLSLQNEVILLLHIVDYGSWMRRKCSSKTINRQEPTVCGSAGSISAEVASGVVLSVTFICSRNQIPLPGSLRQLVLCECLIKLDPLICCTQPRVYQPVRFQCLNFSFL